MVASPTRRVAGSSPLTRGKRGENRFTLAGLRLIPTHAGKTLRSDPLSLPVWAHPHSRGENLNPVDAVSLHSGSSPLTRGKHGRGGGRAARVRLIPTHAGKTTIIRAIKRLEEAHPHSRGENPGSLGTGIVGAGSSPLTRGKLLESRAFDVLSGLIPTHAGKTEAEQLVLLCFGAHPHSRGENWAIRPVRASCWGSSPLTRGKLAVVL